MGFPVDWLAYTPALAGADDYPVRPPRPPDVPVSLDGLNRQPHGERPSRPAGNETTPAPTKPKRKRMTYKWFCQWCGTEFSGVYSQRYCNRVCQNKAYYERKRNRKKV